MKENKALALQESSEKEHTRGQTSQISEPSVFWFPVYDGIFDPPHPQRIGEGALWLYLWYFRRTTREIEEKGQWSGLVLGGQPLRDSEVARGVGFPVWKVRAWRKRLTHHGYIRAKRTPYGHVIRVCKSKRFPRKESALIHALSQPESERIRSQRLNESIHSDGERVHGFMQNKEEDTVGRHSRRHRGKPIPTACSSSREQNQEAWKEIGTEPYGTPKFVRIWENVHGDRPIGELLSVTMERAIQMANKGEVGVPPPFFDAKRQVERREQEELAAPADDSVPVLEGEPWAK